MKKSKIPIEISARHIHLSASDLLTLFGADFNLEKLRELSQPGEFLSRERLTLKTEKGKIEHVAVLGPLREKTQIEISLTDAKKLGLNPPVRSSGNLVGSVGCVLSSDKGTLELREGVIVARRHLHLNLTQAQKLGVKDGDSVSVEIKNCFRPVIFKDVLVRVGENYNLTMHVDTDEGNAAGLTPDSYGEIVNL